LLILSIFEAACIIIQAAFLAKAIVGLFDKNFDNVVRDSVLFLIGYIFRIVFLHLQQYFTENHAIKFETELRRKLLQSYF
ncbi:thiol reductant ABC exporter subunit CydD, partial [Listeria monocytogenes]|nr:thiol reductant ABC exporter subunit CydD [Listeria monocytogenes]